MQEIEWVKVYQSKDKKEHTFKATVEFGFLYRHHSYDDDCNESVAMVYVPKR